MRAWRTGGKLIRMISQCIHCDLVDGAALDRWAEQAYKEQMNQRAQQIALAAGTEPFAFVQQTGQELTLEDVLLQALGAASAHSAEMADTGQRSDGKRETAIYKGLLAEVQRFMRLDRQKGELAAARKVEEQLEPDIKDWMDLAHELYALACNSSPNGGYAEPQRTEWHRAFERLRDRFHELLPDLMEKEKSDAAGDQ